MDGVPPANSEPLKESLPVIMVVQVVFNAAKSPHNHMLNKASHIVVSVLKKF